MNISKRQIVLVIAFIALFLFMVMIMPVPDVKPEKSGKNKTQTFFSFMLTQMAAKNKIDNNTNRELTKKEQEELVEELKKSDGEAKKYNGIKGDITGSEFSVRVTGSAIDLKKKLYPAVYVRAQDPSGIYRIRLEIFYNGKRIGYMQDNPNTKETAAEAVFTFNHRTILDDGKLIKDYEGGEFFYKITSWDNNLNKAEFKAQNGFKVVDNTPPEKLKAYWTYFFDADEKIEVYNRETKNKFNIYKIYDMPNLKENRIKYFEYGYTDLSGKLLFKTQFEEMEEEKKDLVVDVSEEGKYIFYAKAVDLNGNISDKKIKFFVDTTPPTGEIGIQEGIEIPTGESFHVMLNAWDNLSGVFRYRFADSENSIWKAEWQDYKGPVNTEMKSPGSEGIYDVWVQMEDNAFNLTKPQKINYYSKPKNSIQIKSQGASKEIIIELDKDEYKKGNMKIKSYQEK